MKTKLDSIEKERRQEWRNEHAITQSSKAPHHLTRKERLEGREEKSQIVDLRQLTANFFSIKKTQTEPVVVKPVKPKYVKARTRRIYANQTVKGSAT